MTFFMSSRHLLHMSSDLRSKKEYTGEFLIEIGKIRIIFFFIQLKITKWWLMVKCKGKK